MTIWQAQESLKSALWCCCTGKTCAMARKETVHVSSGVDLVVIDGGNCRRKSEKSAKTGGKSPGETSQHSKVVG